MKQNIYRLLLFALVLLTTSVGAIAQKKSDLDLLYWSATNKITLNDFGKKVNNATHGLSYASFSLQYKDRGLNFLKKNFNKNIRHCMIRSASYIIIDGNEHQYIRYHQTLFDLEEIYVRRLRKAIQENSHKLMFTSKIVDKLKNEIIGKNLIQQQTEYNNDTNVGKNLAKQEEWEKRIEKELRELSRFAYER